MDKDIKRRNEVMDEMRRINDAFGGKDGALMMFLARKAIMSSEFETSCDPRRWSGWILTLSTYYK